MIHAILNLDTRAVQLVLEPALLSATHNEKMRFKLIEKAGGAEVLLDTADTLALVLKQAGKRDAPEGVPLVINGDRDRTADGAGYDQIIDALTSTSAPFLGLGTSATDQTARQCDAWLIYTKSGQTPIQSARFSVTLESGAGADTNNTPTSLPSPEAWLLTWLASRINAAGYLQVTDGFHIGLNTGTAPES